MGWLVVAGVAGAGWGADWPYGPQGPRTQGGGEVNPWFGVAQNKTFIKKPSNHSQWTRD